jgi:hypothetical protein
LVLVQELVIGLLHILIGYHANLGILLLHMGQRVVLLLVFYGIIRNRVVIIQLDGGERLQIGQGIRQMAICVVLVVVL